MVAARKFSFPFLYKSFFIIAFKNMSGSFTIYGLHIYDEKNILPTHIAVCLEVVLINEIVVI